MKEAIITLLILATGYLGYSLYAKSEHIPPEQVDTILSDSTRVFSSRLASQRALTDSLRNVSAEALERIESQNERIRTLTTLAGRVRTVRDTLYLPSPVQVPKADTLIVFSQTFSDSLFIVTSELRFKSGAFTNTLDLSQLRDLRIDITMTEKDGYVMTYVTSPDFELNEYRTLQVEPKRETGNRFWLGYGLGGATVAVLVYLLK